MRVYTEVRLFSLKVLSIKLNDMNLINLSDVKYYVLIRLYYNNSKKKTFFFRFIHSICINNLRFCAI